MARPSPPSSQVVGNFDLHNIFDYQNKEANMADDSTPETPEMDPHIYNTGIILGKTYRDRITGFEGIATGFSYYLTGCAQVSINPPVGEDNKYENGRWFDDQRLELCAEATEDEEAETAERELVGTGERRGGPDRGAPRY